MTEAFLRNRSALYGVVLVLIALGLWLPRLRGPLDLRYDAGVYYILGTSLAEGKGYRLLNEPGAIQAIQYPPLLPLFTAAHQWLAGDRSAGTTGHLLRLSYFVMGIALVIAVYRFSGRHLTPGWAFLATLAVVLHVHTSWMSDLLFAELPFALTSMLFLLVVRSPARRSAWLAATLAVAGFLLRSSGIGLLAAWVGESVVRRRFRQMAVRASVALIPVLAWQGYVTAVKGGTEYTQPAYEYQRANYQFYNVGYSDNMVYVDPFAPEQGTLSLRVWLERTGHHLLYMPVSIGESVSVRREWLDNWIGRLDARLPLPSFAGAAGVIWLSVLGSLAIGGLVVLARRGEWILTLYATASVVLISVTPWPGQFERYLWPLGPVFSIGLWTAVALLVRRVSTNRPSWRVAGVTAAVVLVAGVSSTQSLALIKTYRLLSDTASYSAAGDHREYRLFFYGPEWRLHDEALNWLGASVGADEIVATSTPHWLHVKTGLRAVMIPLERDAGEAQRLLDSVPASYLVVDSLDEFDIGRRYGAAVVAAFPERWEMVEPASNAASKVYRRRPHHDAGRSLAALPRGSH